MELLVASAIALLMVAGLVTAFQVISGQVANARATLELSGQLRMGQHLIRQDLANVSAPVRPWLDPAHGHGYFEYFEGPLRDTRIVNSNNSISGDVDDILMFTARNDDEPFRGRYQGGIITSREAEIVIWARWDDANGDNQVDPEEQVTVHRRVLLVRPDLAPAGAANLATFYQNNDVSVRIQAGQLVANSLSDLTKRENRFAHIPNQFPFRIDRSLLESLAQSSGANAPNLGTDVLLSNVLAFDVKAYDPDVEVRAAPNGGAVLPHDNSYGAGSRIGDGGYVDLNHARSTSQFSTLPHGKSGLRFAGTVAYCTWPTHYENDGVYTPPGNGPIDPGTDGLDTDNVNGVDDIGERETMPPYSYPLRGIKVTIRVYEPDSQAVRQTSIVQDFIPE